MKNQIRVFVISLISGLVIGSLATVIHAATVTSNWGYYGPYNGYSYKNRAQLTENGSQNDLNASTIVENQSAGNVPTGYIGVKARLFESDGTLCAENTMSYNSSPTYGSITLVSGDCGSGTYYSKGLSEAYNGNGYSLYHTFQSPNLNH